MGLPLRVLFIDDSDDDVAFLVQVLRNGDYEVTFERVHNADLMSQRLYLKKWDVIISAYHMPDFCALTAYVLIHLRHPRMPFLVVSDSLSLDLRIAAAKVGIPSGNYIVKDNLARELLPAIERVLQAQANQKGDPVRTVGDEASPTQ